MSGLLDDIIIIPVEKFNAVTMLQYEEVKLPAGNRGTKKKFRYLNCVCAFDIETTRLPEIDQSFMYIWQFCVNGEFVVVGRTWSEYLQMLQKIQQYLQGCTLVIYVHNLSYEFSFLKGVYDFAPEDIFALNPRKIAKCRMYGQFEYRCSYVHSNMDLLTYTSKFHAKHVKLADTYDYEKIRYPWTPLSPEELAYCVYDVQGLCEAIRNEMDHDGDTLNTIPLTSTGYVRRDAKHAMRNVSYRWLQECLPDYNTYILLREAFRGGNTHASRFYVRKIVRDVTCVDRSSSYPDTQMNCRFPCGPWRILEHATQKDLQELTADGYAYVIRVALENVRLKDYRRGDPYLPLSKCRHVHGEEGNLDNGRILACSYCEHTCTDIDWKILTMQYDFDTVYIMDCRYSHYGRLPASLRATISEYYRLKTELKGDPDSDILYMKSKNKLNSLYGMSAQDPVRTTIYYDPMTKELMEAQEGDPEYKDPRIEYEKSLKSAFFSYAWGCWVTAWARLRLQEAIEIVGPEDFVYCDTDSVYYVGEHDFTDYNLKRAIDSRGTGAVATDAKGKKHSMGVLEFDHFCTEFKTLGAKKYVYTDDDGLHVTIAGVVKGKAAAELGTIDNFKDGFVFVKAGGIEAVYNDNVCKAIRRDGHELVITDNVCLRPSTYTLGITAEYERLLNGLDVLGVDIV